MNLESFVEESISEICKGLQKAHEAALENGCELNPDLYGNTGTYDKNGRAIQNIAFDVAVTVNESGDVKGGIKVMGIGISGHSTESSTTVSRIKFEVPMSLPMS